MKITFLGGARTVTGTCFLLETDRLRMLVDCGMAQGEGNDTVNRASFAFNPKEIDLLFLTHAHIDHSGLLPRLAKEGFHGKIMATPATVDLAGIMLADSAQIQQADAERDARRALRAGRRPLTEPLYTMDDVRLLMPLFKSIPYSSMIHTGKGVNYRFLDAGHILGSGSLELWFQDGPAEKKIVFSGDIGKIGSPIINDPATPAEADYVVMESTYGNRLHKGMAETIDELVEAIKVTFKRGGNVIIPAFAVGRTQDLLYVLNQLVREGRLYRIDVYIDSPLAEEATRTYLAHPEVFDEEARRLLEKQAGNAVRLRFTGSVEESMALNRVRSHAVIIAGSGMCEGGRIRHHLKHNLWRPECSIVFTGFQARGTLGRRIVDGAKAVNIFGEEIAVKARICTLGGFSAHADRDGLLAWLSSFRNSPEVFVVHGEEQVSIGFSELVKEKLGFVTHVPEKGGSYEL